MNVKINAYLIFGLLLSVVTACDDSPLPGDLQKDECATKCPDFATCHKNICQYSASAEFEALRFFSAVNQPSLSDPDDVKVLFAALETAPNGQENFVLGLKPDKNTDFLKIYEIPERITNASVGFLPDGSPAAIYFKPRKNTDVAKLLFVKYNRESKKWDEPKDIAGDHFVSEDFSALFASDNIHVAYRDACGKNLYYASYSSPKDGIASQSQPWTHKNTIAGSGLCDDSSGKPAFTKHAPSVASVGNKLYIAYRDLETGSQNSTQNVATRNNNHWEIQSLSLCKHTADVQFTKFHFTQIFPYVVEERKADYTIVCNNLFSGALEGYRAKKTVVLDDGTRVQKNAESKRQFRKYLIGYRNSFWHFGEDYCVKHSDLQGNIPTLTCVGTEDGHMRVRQHRSLETKYADGILVRQAGSPVILYYDSKKPQLSETSFANQGE